ncbi:hypothetical protein M0208_15360 [Sphingomonas sp. SUN019]|uniref:hypothetical protein n=1 Tax=Sphingomonas sp. SUN019 TaxID=2937788 RepID=UPI0021647029|nr:hypothetical protein [Sphingomonas sp. SUN019]UVO51820.1 hypothetical protein M0208_15360 [Sphingomonas sp. SUN019]
MMRDDFLTRDWADHQNAFARDINKLFRSIGMGLARLHEYQFDAPWRTPDDRDRRPVKH